MTGIVILDYNNAQDTINCIESVVKYTPRGTYKLFVVENGSNNDTSKIITQFVNTKFTFSSKVISDNEIVEKLPFITLLISTTNSGYASGNNKALKYFDKDDDINYIMILNNDIIFVEDIVTPLVKYSQKIPQCGLISPLLYKKDNKSIDYNCAHKDYVLPEIILNYLFCFANPFGLVNKYNNQHNILINHPEYLERESFDMEMPSGSCMLIEKTKFQTLGYFDENTFLYFEENILYKKSENEGLKSYMIPSLKCIHLGASTTGKSKTSSFLMKQHMKSQAYYLRQYCNSPILSLYVVVMSRLTILKIFVKNLIVK